MNRCGEMLVDKKLDDSLSASDVFEDNFCAVGHYFSGSIGLLIGSPVKLRNRRGKDAPSLKISSDIGRSCQKLKTNFDAFEQQIYP